MVRSRTFSSKKSTKKPEEVSFELDGVTYQCKPKRSGATVLEVASKLVSEGGFSGAAEIPGFIASSVLPEDEEKIKDQLYSDENPIEFEVLVEIAAYLLEVYTGSRPTEG